ncbi:MAG: hypothetical protein IPH62_15350 [Ignavibacteriae bacterium]|nr:hypothetical protein [Ignavibacteriota bacterium]
MKKYIQLFCLLFVTTIAYSQTAFDKSVSEATSDLANKLIQKNKKKAVVLYITDLSKLQTVAGKYIADVVSYNLVNNTGSFEVFDRENLSGITEAKKLIAEGYIDVNTAKELGKILSVEAIIIGNYTVLSNTMKLNLKALDANSGFVIAATMKDLILDSDAGSLLGINIETNTGKNNSNRGFNDRPLNSNEDYNNPETVNKECEIKNTGDYCFTNSTVLKISLQISSTEYPFKHFKMTLEPGQTQCFYDLVAQTYEYNYHQENYNPGAFYRKNEKDKTRSGQILVEKCKSKTFIIK